VRRFVDTEIVPHNAQWEKDGVVPVELWHKAGAAGLLACTVSEEYGGVGGTFLHNAIVIEELARISAMGPAFPPHSVVIAPYIMKYGSEEQRRTWLPKMVSGEAIGAIAMTEPDTGSDLQNIKTRAVRDGDDYVINGQKMFISNGQIGNLILVACKTDPDAGGKGTSMIIVEGDRKGLVRGRNLEKLGMKAQDTSELFFEDLRVPLSNLIGEEGKGFAYMMTQLPEERLMIGVRSVAIMEAALQWTIDYTDQRKAFGKRIADFQNTKFQLADVKSDIVVARAFVDRCIELHMQGKLDASTGAVIKLHCAELLNRVLDRCLQLHGGYGYMWEFPICRAFADARVTRIAGGSSEIMRELISRTLEPSS
ncbi:MAG: acyl-CoA dehydrogenase family protein, partial [Alphaproteobacteria bacterium]